MEIGKLQGVGVWENVGIMFRSCTVRSGEVVIRPKNQEDTETYLGAERGMK